MRRLTIPVFLLLATAAFAQKTEPAPPATTTTVISSDSRETRKEFDNLLYRLPSEVGVVLKLDPTLFNNPQYLATYPELASFVAQHPDISHNPRFYLADVPHDVAGVYVPDQERRVRSQVMWDKVMEGFMIMVVFGTIVGVIVWFIRTVIEQTRWSRVARAQNEIHGKLLERLASNEELLRYMETAAGRRFLESAPIPVEGARVGGAPLGRILWSVQAGLVLAAAGIGLDVVSYNVDKDAAQPLYAMGIVGICVGVGFVLSAVIAFVLSRRLKLLQSPETP